MRKNCSPQDLSLKRDERQRQRPENANPGAVRFSAPRQIGIFQYLFVYCSFANVVYFLTNSVFASV